MSLFAAFRMSLSGPALATAALLFMLAASSGCINGTEAKPLPPEHRAPPKTAMAILERVVEAYHHANRYKDNGRLIVKYNKEGATYQDTSKFELTLAGPNRMRLHAYNALVVCDGENFRATIDEAPGEILSVSAPDELSPGAVYRDPVLGKALNQVVGSVPLSLFLDPEPLPGFEHNAHVPQLDEPEKIDGDLCFRVRIAKREGTMVLWIDQKTFVVRRVEYPADGYKQLVEPYPGAVTGMTIIAEHENARLDPPISDDEFRFEVPPEADLVKQFDVVLVGARIPRFKLRALDGSVITRESLAEKIVVLRFLRKDEMGKYRDDLAGLEEIRKRYLEQKGVVFLTVSADGEDVSDAELKAAFDEAGLTLPITRIDLKVAFRSFGLQVAPTTIILGRNGSLQEYLPGIDPDQATSLPKKIDTLLSGGELVLEAPHQPLDYRYYSAFSWQGLQPTEEEAPAAPPEFAIAETAPASEPEFLRLKPLWRSTELKSPGNFLVVRQPDGNEVYVLDESSRVVQLSADGQVSMTHRLELADDDSMGVSFLRTAVDGDGKRFFLAFAAGARRLYVFNKYWRPLLDFPEQEDQRLPIADARLADLDGDGKLEILVGYYGLVGTHCVGFDGKTVWRNRAAENVLGLGVTPADRHGRRELLVAQGLLLPVSATGNEQTPIMLPDSFIRSIYTSDLGPAELSHWCAVAVRPASSAKRVRDIAVGISPRGTVLWRYPLPAGTHRHAAIEMVASGDLFRAGVAQWVIAAADGSIHILALDGSLLDRYNSGVSLGGVAIANLAGEPALLLAGDNGIEAWQFVLPPREETDAAGEEASSD